MASASRAIVIRFLGNTSGLNGAANQGASSIEKFAKRARLAGLSIAVAAGAMAKQAIQIASDTSEAMSKTQQVFGASAAAVTAFAQTSATQYGISKRAAFDYVSGIGAVLTAQGQSQKTAKDVGLSYTKLAADMASFSNTSIEDAAAALTSSLTGEFEPLKRYGVVLNDARLAEEAQREGMKKSGATWSASQKAALSYAIVMHDTAQAQGDFARTSAGLANQQRIEAATAEDLKGKLGAGLLPIQIAVTGAMIKAVDWAVKHEAIIKKVAIGVGVLAVAMIVLPAIFTAVAFATGGWATSFWALNAAMAANPVGAIVVGVLAVAAAAVFCWKRFETFRVVVSTVVNFVTGIWFDWAHLMVNVWIGAVEGIVKGAAKAFGWIPGIGGKLKDAANAVAGFKDQVNANLDAIQNDVTIRLHVVTIRTIANGNAPAAIDQQHAEQRAAQEQVRRQSASVTQATTIPNFSIQSGGGGGGSGGGSAPKAAKTKAVKAAAKTGREILDAFLQGASSRFPMVSQTLTTWADKLPVKLGHGLDRIVAKVEASMASVTKAQEKNSTALDAAKAKLNALRDTTIKFRDSVRDGILALGDLGSHGGESFDTIKEKLTQSLANAQHYVTTIKALKAGGLSQSALQQLIEAGPGAATQTGQAILAGGTAGIGQINALQAQITKVAGSTATALGEAFYRNGLTQAEGVVAGLKAKDAALKAQMTDLGKTLALSVQTQLGVTPSSGTAGGLKVSGKRALGGPVMAGRSYLVGERGPELFTPGHAGGITPNGADEGSYVVEIHGRDSDVLEAMVEKVVIRRDRRRKGGLQAGAKRSYT